MEAVKQSTKAIDTNVTLDFKHKFYYAVGDMGYNLMYYWVSTFLMIFYTDVFGISMVAVSTLMLVVRIFDAVNDPLIGAMADRTKQKTGSYGKWIQWGSFSLGISCILLFWAHPGWSTPAKIIYMYVTYCIVVCASTATNMPYGVLNGTLTTNVVERTRISTMRMFMITLGNMGVTALAIPTLNLFGLNSGHPSRAYILALILFSLIAVPMLWTTALKSKEVVMMPETQTKVPMNLRFKGLIQRPMMAVTLGMVFYGFVYYGRVAVLPYYFTYFVEKPAMLTLFGVLIGVGGLIGSVFTTSLHRLFKHKGRTSAANMLFCGVVISLMFWFPPHTNPVIFYALTLLNGISQGIHLCMQYSIIPDAIDYSYYKTGVNVSGFLYACTSFGFKLGNAVATAIAAAVLGYLGYVANVAQTPQVISGINIMVTFATGVFCVITAICFGLYNISDKKYYEMYEEIGKREAKLRAFSQNESIDFSMKTETTTI